MKIQNNTPSVYSTKKGIAHGFRWQCLFVFVVLRNFLKTFILKKIKATLEGMAFEKFNTPESITSQRHIGNSGAKIKLKKLKKTKIIFQ